jgi:hypothetical protein
MSGTSAMPVNWDGIYLTETESGYTGSFTTNDFYFVSTTNYSGEAYADEGTITTDVYTTVQMDIEFTMTVNNGVVETRATGKIYHSATTEGMTGVSPDIIMTFDLTKTS